jgi:hypothetical protein
MPMKVRISGFLNGKQLVALSGFLPDKAPDPGRICRLLLPLHSVKNQILSGFFEKYD